MDTEIPNWFEWKHCAIAANAEYLATEDNHFQVLKKISFPKIQVINFEELKAILKK